MQQKHTTSYNMVFCYQTEMFSGVHILLPVHIHQILLNVPDCGVVRDQCGRAYVVVVREQIDLHGQF